MRLFERTAETLVLEDEAEEERERQENELATGETTTVPGQKLMPLPSRKTVTSEKGVIFFVMYLDEGLNSISHVCFFFCLQAELIMECIDISKEFKEQLLTIDPSKAAPPLPLQMQMYQCESVEDYLLETLKRIRAR